MLISIETKYACLIVILRNIRYIYFLHIFTVPPRF
jgi:hypothetical protein